MKSMKYVTTIALATFLTQGSIVATDTTPTPPAKSAAELMREHAEQERKQAAANKAAREIVARKLKEQAAIRNEADNKFKMSLRAMKTRHTTEKNALKSANDEKMKELLAKQQAEIDQLTKAHAEKMTALKAQHEEEAQAKAAKHLGT